MLLLRMGDDLSTFRVQNDEEGTWKMYKYFLVFSPHCIGASSWNSSSSSSSFISKQNKIHFKIAGDLN